MGNADFQVVDPGELKLGMYVVLPLSWHEHPFLKNHFLIESETDIQKIRGLGLKSIPIDPARSRLVQGQTAPAEKPPTASGPEPPAAARKVATEDLIAVIHDGSLPPAEKSVLVRQHSITMMKGLLESPTVQNMKETQKAISEVVSLILTDDETLHYLLDITSHDYYTYTHSVSVGVLSIALAKALFKDATNHDMRALGVGFFLHDVGKVSINPAIITKPGRLTDAEMQEMRRHPSLGYKLLHETKQLTEESRIIVLQHHERVDGKGYPKGLRGGEIHVYGRICSIADVYDALTSDRPYRKKLPPVEALKIMHDEMIDHFQKDLFMEFIKMFKKKA
ncbi:MAG: HD-GYP domain-containing protein [Deltaproteobacteria bacterium]|nr:HD-GYP domain-containing protein [Deltaproteobacteria bacterium]